MKSFNVAFALLSTAGFTYASPILCKYAIENKPYPTDKYIRYNIGQVYLDAELVVIGHANEKIINKSQSIFVAKVIKGRANAQITLIGLHSAGTDPSGASIPVGDSYLMFLKNGPQFAWVEPGYCANAFKVSNGKIKMGHQLIDIDNLEKYLKSKPTLIE